MDITANQIITQIRRLAQERPDFNYSEQPGRESKYNACGYVGLTVKSTEGEGCIVGQALQALGMSKEELLKVETRLFDTNDGTSVRELLPALGIERTYEDRMWLSAVQRAQDQGLVWSEAVQHADSGYTL